MEWAVPVEGAEVLQVMLTWDAVHHIIPKKPQLLEAHSGEGREKRFFSSSAFHHPQGSVCITFCLSSTALPLLGAAVRIIPSSAAATGRWEQGEAGKGGWLRAEGTARAASMPWGMEAALQGQHCSCSLLASSQNPALPAQTIPPRSHGTSRRGGTVAGQGGWLPAWLVVRGR